MELRYCDSCGTILRADSTTGANNKGRFVCERCQTASDSTGAPVSGSSANDAIDALQPAHDGAPRADGSPLSFLEEAGKNTGQSQEAGAGDSPALDASSHGSLEDLPRMGSSSPPSCDDDGRPAPTAATESFDDSLSLFSAKTIVARKQAVFGQLAHDTAEISLAVDDRLEEDTDTPLTLQPNPGGSHLPAQTARRIKFHCIECSAVLVVRPVKRTSKMVCPGCQSRLHIDSDGQVTRRHPERESVAEQSHGGTIVPNLHTSRTSEEEQGERPSAEGCQTTVDAVEKVLEKTAKELQRLDSEGPPVDTAGAQEDESSPELPEEDASSVDGVARDPGGGRHDLDNVDGIDDSGSSFDPLPGLLVSPDDRIRAIDDSRGFLKALAQATFFGLLLATPLLIFGSLASSGDSVVVEARDSVTDRALEKTGATVEKGLRRLIDKLAELTAGQ